MSVHHLMNHVRPAASQLANSEDTERNSALSMQ